MKLPIRTVVLFQRSLHLWLLGFLVSALPAAEGLWEYPVSPALSVSSGRLSFVTDALNTWLPQEGVLVAVALLLLLCIRGLFRNTGWLLAVIIWVLYTGLMNRAWLAGSGGQQLMSNLLFWNIPLSFATRKEDQGLPIVASTSAFWILRLQVLLAYAVTGAHKLTGSMWLDGTAMGVVSSDPSFGPHWIADVPLLAMGLTWAVLLFQISFPVAVWWRSTQVPWMMAGVLFHLGTAWWMGIPEMGLAFIAAYTIWLDDGQAGWILDRFSRINGRSLLRVVR